MTISNSDTRLDRLALDALTGKVTRRRFMEGALALGLTVPAATAMWSNRVVAQTPKKGGTYRAGIHNGNTTDSLDPGTTAAIYMIQLNHCFRSYLTEITSENGLGPDAADSWEATPDAKTWRFNLAKGIEFHDGKPFTSKDAVASLNFHRGESTKSAAKALLTDVEDVKADGDHTIVITMKTGNADLPWLMSDYHLVMMAADGEGNIIEPQGTNATGPYKITKFEPGIATELVRHGNYHRAEQAHFEAVKMVVLNDVNARQTALATGEVDAITEPDLKTLHLLMRNKDIEIDEVPSGAAITLPMFCDTAPFDNLDVRLALKLAIDREDMLNKIVLGHGTLGNDQPIGPTLPYWADLPQRAYDPDQARSLLKKAGMENLKVRLSASDGAVAGSVDLATLYREHALKAGIEIEIVREPADGYWENVWLKKPFCTVNWGARPTPDVMFSLAYKDDAAWNESHWKNPRFNELLLQAKAELDEAKRTGMYREMQSLCRDDGGTILPYFLNRVGARRKDLQHGPSIAGNWELDGARSYQRWWFDS